MAPTIAYLRPSHPWATKVQKARERTLISNSVEESNSRNGNSGDNNINNISSDTSINNINNISQDSDRTNS